MVSFIVLVYINSTSNSEVHPDWKTELKKPVDGSKASDTGDKYKGAPGIELPHSGRRKSHKEPSVARCTG